MDALDILVLGAAAGGGFPQWNCGCRNCARARSGDPAAPPRSQAGLAATADGESWVLLGASPDLREQLLAQPVLAPRALRHSPVAAVVLLNADIDGVAGLLALREQQPFALYAPSPILTVLAANGIFGVLDPALVHRRAVTVGESFTPVPGLSITLIEMPGKVPLYAEDRAAALAEAGPTYAARLDAHGRVAIAAPACAELPDDVLDRLRPAELLLFDGTVFHDDEMPAAGLGKKTGRRMGHVPMAGPGGSLERLGTLSARRVYYHINNTNPVLLADSTERAALAEADFEVAEDGKIYRLPATA